MMKRYSTLSSMALLILPLLSISGCAASYGYYYSKPVVAGNIAKYKPNGITVLDLKDVAVYLYPVNHTSLYSGFELPIVPIPIGPDSPEHFDYSQDYFDIEIYLHSRLDGFSFNPKEVYLKLDNGKIYQPNQIVMHPGRTYWVWAKGPHNLLRPDPRNSSWEKDKRILFKSEYIGLTKDGKDCADGYILRFETATPKPGIPFDIEIKGLKRFDSDVLIPGIEYTDRARLDWTYY